jgi:hypothetical protein
MQFLATFEGALGHLFPLESEKIPLLSICGTPSAYLSCTIRSGKSLKSGRFYMPPVLFPYYEILLENTILKWGEMEIYFFFPTGYPIPEYFFMTNAMVIFILYFGDVLPNFIIVLP